MNKTLDSTLALDPDVGAAMSFTAFDARIRSIKGGWRTTPIQNYFPSGDSATATLPT